MSIKSEIIALMLGTSAGRSALSDAMMEPLRRRVDYEAVGRRRIIVEPLPEDILKANGFLKFDHLSTTKSHMLFRQKSTGIEKWVPRKGIREEGIEVAFYDADSTWRPE